MSNLKVISEKLSYLSAKSEIVVNICNNISNDHVRRILFGSILVCTEVYLDYISQYKNELKKINKINKNQNVELKNKIKKLSDDYDIFFRKVRNSVVGHRLNLDILNLFEYWNNIDQTLVIFNDLIKDINNKILLFTEQKEDISGNNYLLNNIINVCEEINKKFPKQTTVKSSNDGLALTQPNTIGVIPCSDSQRKMLRINSLIKIFDILAEIINLTDHKTKFFREVIASMMILCGINLIDNLYEDRSNDKDADCVLDRSLLTIWTEKKFKGLNTIRHGNISRNIEFENKSKLVRNHFAGHLDNRLSLDEIRHEFIDLSFPEFYQYIKKHVENYQKAGLEDELTRSFTVIDFEIKEAIGVENTEIVKPFEY